VGEGRGPKICKKELFHRKTFATVNNIRKTYTGATEKEEKAQALKINKIMGHGRLDTILSSYSISAIDYSSYNPIPTQFSIILIINMYAAVSQRKQTTSL
jgi:hypothetical protein